MKKKDARHVRGVVDGLLKKWQDGTVKRADAVRTAWDASVEDETKKQAHPISFRNGVLLVAVPNSSWLYKLTMEKKNILEKFNGHYTGRKKARDIRFRTGTAQY